MKKLTSKILTKTQETQAANLDVISESCKDEEGDDEEVKELDLEVEKALKQAAAEEKKGEIEAEEEVKFLNNLMINNTYASTYKEYEAVCHSFFIAKDNTEINWRRPYVQQSSVQCKLTISSTAFAEGAMRYAFLAFDKTYGEGYVVKLPKKISAKTYNLEEMKQDLESIFICKLIVDELNERLISKIDSKYLVEFVQAFIYEITT